MKKTTIPCPVCHTLIEFKPKELISGKSITCPKCETQIGLAKDDMSSFLNI